MTLSTVWSIITRIIDISIVWFMFYYILKNVKNNIIIYLKSLYLLSRMKSKAL